LPVDGRRPNVNDRAMPSMTVASLWRYPVKSMQGEALASTDVVPGGLVGDRAFALIDTTTGKVASAKHPRKWARLLECAAAFVEPPVAGQPLPPARITLPDGSEARSDDAGVDEVLSAALGAPVTLAAVAPEAGTLEEVWPLVDDLAPAEFIEQTTVSREAGGEPVSDIRMALAAPPGTFFDLAEIHLLTTATLARLARAYPEGQFDPRRYRPNALIAADADAFVENEWTGGTMTLGTVEVRIDLPTMRCVMTTLAQPGLPRDVGVLRTVARQNRVDIPGLGRWACAGSYGTVRTPGTLRVGDPVTFAGP
jgi:uncharacterized protein